MTWGAAHTKDVAEIFNGKTPSKAEQRQHGHPVLKIKDVDAIGAFRGVFSGFVDEDLAEKHQKKWIQGGETLILNAAHNASHVASKTFFADADVAGAMATGEWLMIRWDESQVDPRFGNHWINQPATRFQLRQIVNGIHLYPRDVARLNIPLPPLAKQKRIAKILDAADALRAKRRESLAQLDTLLQSTFLEMFGDPVKNPRGWKVVDLGEVLEKVTDGTHHSPGIVDDGVPYITAKHLKSNGLRFFDNPWFVSEQSHREIYARCNPEKGDVLYIKDGATTGLAAINRYDFQFSMLSSLALLKVDYQWLYPEFLCAWLNSPRTRSHLLQGLGGAAIKRLTLTKIKKFKIPVPPLSIQEEFGQVLSAIDGIRKRCDAQLGELDGLFGALQQQAFSGQP